MRKTLAFCATSLLILSATPVAMAGDSACDPAKDSCTSSEQKSTQLDAQSKAATPESDTGSASSEPADMKPNETQSSLDHEREWITHEVWAAP